MKILLFGKNGQVGWELQRSLAPLGEIIALDRNEENGLSGDLSDIDSLKKTISQTAPDVIVNAAAYTAVDKAESETDQALRINAEAPQVMAEEAKKTNALLVHYSTDYVFNGTGTNFWKESDKIEPVNAYGKSKAVGEAGITATACRNIIFRTSWVYGFHGNNFIKKILQLAGEREKLTIVIDQFGVPTGAELISDVTAHCIRSVIFNKTEPGGIYHLVPSGETTWYDLGSYAIEIAQKQGRKMAVKEVLPVPSSEFKTPALRPANSRMSTEKLRTDFSLYLPDWKSGVKRMVEELIWKKN